MYKIRMLETSQGAEDRIQVKTYLKGQVYEVPEHLYKNFRDAGFIELVCEDDMYEVAAEMPVPKKRGRPARVVQPVVGQVVGLEDDAIENIDAVVVEENTDVTPEPEHRYEDEQA